VHIILETPRLTMRQFTEDDVALTKPEWEARTAGDARS
jgi:hypothetical protein